MANECRMDKRFTCGTHNQKECDYFEQESVCPTTLCRGGQPDCDCKSKEANARCLLDFQDPDGETVKLINELATALWAMVTLTGRSHHPYYDELTKAEKWVYKHGLTVPELSLDEQKERLKEGSD